MKTLTRRHYGIPVKLELREGQPVCAHCGEPLSWEKGKWRHHQSLRLK